MVMGVAGCDAKGAEMIWQGNEKIDRVYRGVKRDVRLKYDQDISDMEEQLILGIRSFHSTCAWS